MSSSKRGGSGGQKRPRACDFCKKQKKRCGGMILPATGKCLICTEEDIPCTWVSATVPTRRFSATYVRDLEARVEETERLLREMQAKQPSSREDNGHLPNVEASMIREHLMVSAHARDAECFAVPGLHGAASGPSIPDEDDSLESSDDERHAGLLFRASQRGEEQTPLHYFIGRSSGAHLVRQAIHRRLDDSFASLALDKLAERKKRDICKPCPWEEGLFDDPGERTIQEPYDFPSDDLIAALVDLYFARWNSFYPLLHRPTLEQSFTAGLHRLDRGFAVTLLLVCALGSRFSSDARVFLDPANPASAGWTFFNQVHWQLFTRPVLARPCLYDLQMYCLSALFLQGSSASSACWVMIGIGIRRAQEVGAHRRKVYNRTPTVDDELWKRAFWILLRIDQSIAYGLGRSCAIQDEDFDLDLPVCCDDEYWTAEEGRAAFQQPDGKPSYVAFFLRMIDLYRILGVALRTIYSINKSKMTYGFVGPRWEQRVVSELDSALNKWIDAIPAHLLWDSDRKNDSHFAQSAQLYMTYRHLQIIVHRPFISMPRKSAPAHGQPAQPSLAICAHAAHAFSRVVDAMMARRDVLALPHMALAAFTSALILMLSIWGRRSTRASADVATVLADVHACIRAIRALEERWTFVYALREILSELLAAGNFSSQQANSGPLNANSPVYPLTGQDRSSRETVSVPSMDGTPSPGPFSGSPSNPRSLPEQTSSPEDLAREPRATWDAERTDATSLPPPPGGPRSVPQPSAKSPSNALEHVQLGSRDEVQLSALFNDTSSVWSDLLSEFELEGWKSYFDLVGGLDADPFAPSA